MKSLFICLALVAGVTSPSIAVAAAQKYKIRVLARVAGNSVTDRQVYLDTVIEKPQSYKSGENLAATELELGLQRVLSQYMVDEENKVLAVVSADPKEVTQQLNQFKRAMGLRYAPFVREWDVKEAELRRHITQKIILQKIIDSRLRSSLAEFEARAKGEGKVNNESERQASARAALEDWFKQLQARYRVIRMGTP